MEFNLMDKDFFPCKWRSWKKKITFGVDMSSSAKIDKK